MIEGSELVIITELNSNRGDSHKKNKNKKATEVFINVIEMESSSFTSRKYKMFPMYVSSLSHEDGLHICGVHPHVRERIHAPETLDTTSFTSRLLLSQ